MKTLIIYKSQTGFTKKYAEWIEEELRCDVMDVKNANEKTIQTYDVVIYGGGIVAGQIKGLKKMKFMMQNMKSKSFIVYCTGATAMNDTDKINEVAKVNFSEEEKKAIPFYYFQGGMNYEKMKLPTRLLMKTMSNMLEKKEAKTNGKMDETMSLKESFDHSDKKYIQPLIDLVKGL